MSNSPTQARIDAILGSSEAKGREDLANHLAFKTTLSADDAIAALAASARVGDEITASLRALGVIAPAPSKIQSKSGTQDDAIATLRELDIIADEQS